MNRMHQTDIMTLYKLVAINYDKYAKDDQKPDQVVSEILIRSTQKHGYYDPIIRSDQKTIAKFVSYFSKYENHEEAKIEIFNMTLFGFRIV